MDGFMQISPLHNFTTHPLSEVEGLDGILQVTGFSDFSFNPQDFSGV